MHEVIRAELVPFLVRARSGGTPVARFVEREVRAYLECGVLAHGFLRVRCDDCGKDRLVAFSCKGRGFCPSCGGRRMADTAAHLVDRVLPEVPIRQWVLTLPYPLRYRCAWNAKLTSEILRCFLRAVFADQRRRARVLFGIRKAQCGSVTFIQRFGSALNLTPHFHALVLDGVYPGPSNAPGVFEALPPPSTEDVARVLVGTARRIARLLEGWEVAGEDDPLAGEDPLMAMLGAASIRSRIVTGPEAGDPWRRMGDRVEPIAEGEASVEALAAVPPRCVRQGGMSLHADVAVPARDRQRLERLCRYVARPPLALGRLEAMADGRLAYRLKTLWRDGTTHVVMERRELLERLAPLIPPPRAHQVRYHGVLAPCASGRDRVVPAGAGKGERANEATRPDESSSGSDGGSIKAVDGGGDFDAIAARASSDLRDEGLVSLARRMAWADLLKRVFEVDALRCPGCGGRMRLIAAITGPSAAHRILEHLELPSRAPPLAPATDIEFEPVVGFDEREPALSGADGAPEYDFDPSQIVDPTADDES
ncbi:MAG: transposase [Myxococcota bacterium]